MSCGVDYPENSENHDSEETFLKSVFHNGDDFISGDNYITPTPVANMTYPSSPPLDKDGNIQCAQEGDARRDAGCRDSTVNFQLECVVIDLLDRELIGLPKDCYLRKLLTTTDSSAEVISNYRAELSKRAKSCISENTPVGILKDRRKTKNTSIAEKLAGDCYQLQQFLEYNITDVDDLYRKTLNTPLVQNQTMNSPCAQSTLMLPNLKEDLVSLKADILFLKRSVSESDSKFERLCANLIFKLRTSEQEKSHTHVYICDICKH